jgi:protein-L-isoaspartate(D-aspartate) O-methyltransferase
MSDFTRRRHVMVDTQVRPADVTKFPIIEAMLSVAREDFVPVAQREAAYIGENLDLGAGRVILEPRTLAKMLDALDIGNDELVADIGAGLGYSSAVIARMAEAVVAVEEDETLAADSQEALSAVGADNVALHVGPLVEGAPQHGPYDVMIIEGGVERFPQTLADQIKDGGRVACLFMEGALGEVRIGRKQGRGITWRMAFNASAPVLPGFTREAAFEL